MKQSLFLLLIVIVVGLGFYILTPNPVVKTHGSPSPVSPAPAAGEPLATMPAASPASTPFPSRNFWPTEVTLKKEETFSQTMGSGEIRTALPAGTIVQVQDIVAGMLSAKRGGMTTQVNVEDTDFGERVERMRGLAAHEAPTATPSDNKTTMPPGQTIAGSKAPIVFVSRNHHAGPITPAPANTPPPAAPPINNSGIIGPYNGLAAGNIMVVATPSTEPGAPPDETTNGSSRDPHGGKMMEVRLSENGVAGEPAQVEFFIVVKTRGGHESIVSKPGTQDPSTPGRWTFDMEAAQPAFAAPAAAPEVGHGNESRLLGWFVRAIRNGRVIGYSASSFNYEQYAMNPATVNASLAR